MSPGLGFFWSIAIAHVDTWQSYVAAGNDCLRPWVAACLPIVLLHLPEDLWEATFAMPSAHETKAALTLRLRHAPCRLM